MIGRVTRIVVCAMLRPAMALCSSNDGSMARNEAAIIKYADGTSRSPCTKHMPESV